MSFPRCTYLVLALAAGASAVRPWSLPWYASPSDTPYVVGVREGQVYAKGGTAAGDLSLKLDVYQPVGLENRSKAALVLIHGGAFVTGDRGVVSAYCRGFASLGLSVFSIDYRLERDTPMVALGPGMGDNLTARTMRAAVIDAKAALRYVHAHADEFGVDTADIFIGGLSAGAITALVAAATPADVYVSDTTGHPVRLENSPGASASVRGVVDFCGGMYRDLSYLDGSDPPVVIYHGEADSTVPFQQALDLRDRCAQVGLECEFHSVPGGGHCPSRGAEEGPPWTVFTSFVMRHLTPHSSARSDAKPGRSRSFVRSGPGGAWRLAPPPGATRAVLRDFRGRAVQETGPQRGWDLAEAERGMVVLEFFDRSGKILARRTEVVP